MLFITLDEETMFLCCPFAGISLDWRQRWCFFVWWLAAAAAAATVVVGGGVSNVNVVRLARFECSFLSNQITVLG